VDVVVAPGVEGLGSMLAELVRANLARDPARTSLLRAPIARVNVRAEDADAAVGIVFGAGAFRVHPDPIRSPDLEVATDGETLMALTSAPLRFGLPDVGTPEGRAILGKMVRRELRVRGMLAHLPVLVRLNKLLTVT
jgi:hypothetical protein